MQNNNEKHHVESDPSFMRCVLEADLQKDSSKALYWRRVYAASKMDGSDGGDSRRCATRVYQLVVFRQSTDVGIKFWYDFKNNYAKMDICPLGQKIIEHTKKGDLKPEIIASKLGVSINGK